MSHLAAEEHVVQVHDYVDDFFLQFQHELNEIDVSEHRFPLAHRALNSVGIDALAMHRAVRHLCNGGYSVACPPILRTMMDLVLGVGVLTDEAQDHDFMALKYSRHFIKARLAKATTSDREKAELQVALKDTLAECPERLREQVKQFFYKERTQPYWWCPEFDRPSALVERYVGPDLHAIYDHFSGGSHGGYLGLRSFRDDPHKQSADPEPHPKAQTLALTTSSWMMLHIFSYRANFEGLLPHARLEALYDLFQSSGEFVRGHLDGVGPIAGKDPGPPRPER